MSGMGDAPLTRAEYLLYLKKYGRRRADDILRASGGNPATSPEAQRDAIASANRQTGRYSPHAQQVLAATGSPVAAPQRPQPSGAQSLSPLSRPAPAGAMPPGAGLSQPPQSRPPERVDQTILDALNRGGTPYAYLEPGDGQAGKLATASDLAQGGADVDGVQARRRRIAQRVAAARAAVEKDRDHGMILDDLNAGEL